MSCNTSFTSLGIFQFSHAFGFGLMDGGKLVKLAKKWKNVPKQIECATQPENNSEEIDSDSEGTFFIDATSCAGIQFLEHALVRNIKVANRVQILMRGTNKPDG